MPTLCIRPTRSRPRSPLATSSTSVAATPERGEHGVGVLEEQGSGGGEPHRPRSAGPVEHGRAGHPLEGGDLLAHRRLRVAERLGRLSEGAGFGDGDEGLEVTHLELHPPKYQ